MSDEQTTEREDQEQGSGEQKGDGAADAKNRNKELEEEYEKAKEEVKGLEDDPPGKLEDWPKGRAMYETFGGPEGEHGYHEGPEENLGPSSLRHRDDGTVEIEGKEVDDPDEYKGDPIPGGPTDPDSPNQASDKASPDDAPTVDTEESKESES
jgi:hypothetical protein